MSIRNISDIRTTSDLRVVADGLGSHMFSPGAMRAFGSRLSSHLRRVDESNGYFVTSERDPFGYAWDGQRRYSVRSYSVVGSVGEDGRYRDAIRFDTIHHGEFGTMREAVKAMNAL